MPNQNNPDPTKSGDAPVSIFPQPDLPPLPDFMSADSSASSVPNHSTIQPSTNVPDSSSGSADNLPQMITTPKKKFGGKIIATILGVFLLIGGVGTGVYLVRQQQNLASQATFNQKDIVKLGSDRAQKEYADARINDAQYGTNTASSTDLGKAIAADPALQAVVKAELEAAGATTNNNVLANVTKPWIPEGYTKDQVVVSDAGLNRAGYDCGGPCLQETDSQVAGYYTYKGRYYPIDTSVPRVGGRGGDGGTTTTETPTAPPSGPTAECNNVKAYSSTWTLLSSTSLSTLAVGTTINFCVAGTTTEGTFDKAQFKINTTLKPETTTVRPGSTDYCQSYTILSTDTTVNVQAKIHHVTLGWFGETI